MGYATAGEIIGRAVVQCGCLSLSQSQVASFDPWSSTEPNVILMVEYLRTLGRGVAKKVKAGRITEATITTAASATTYAVPADYESMVDGTAWDRSGTRPLYGPVTPQFNQWYKAWRGGTGAYIPFRLQGPQIEFPEAPTNGLTLKYEYISSYWVRSTGSAVPDKEYPTVYTDVVLIDDELMVLGLRLMWSEHRGFDTTVLAKEYADELNDAIGTASGGQTLSLNGPGFADRLVDGDNLPITGWGT